jgi:hypothetical protein
MIKAFVDTPDERVSVAMTFLVLPRVGDYIFYYPTEGEIKLLVKSVEHYCDPSGIMIDEYRSITIQCEVVGNS